MEKHALDSTYFNFFGIGSAKNKYKLEINPEGKVLSDIMVLGLNHKILLSLCVDLVILIGTKMNVVCESIRDKVCSSNNERFFYFLAKVL